MHTAVNQTLIIALPGLKIIVGKGHFVSVSSDVFISYLHGWLLPITSASATSLRTSVAFWHNVVRVKGCGGAPVIR